MVIQKIRSAFKAYIKQTSSMFSSTALYDRTTLILKCKKQSENTGNSDTPEVYNNIDADRAS